ncbi:MAG: thiamine transporter permease, partial [Paenibacillus sp.]|nr:thiamine transporter permease [Paenibacillus sp.]
MRTKTSSTKTQRQVPLRRILALFRPYRSLSAWIVIAAFLGALLSLAPPLLMKAIIDSAIPDKNVEQMLLLGGGVLAISILGGLLDVWQNNMEHKVGQHIMFDLRLSLYRNLQRQTMSFYTQSRSGEIVQRLTGDIQMVQTIVTKGVVTAVQIQEIKSDISAHLVETTGISGALLTRLYGVEQRNTQRYTEFNTRMIGLELKMYFIGRWVAMCNSLQPSISLIAIYVCGGYSVMHGDMTVGGIVAFAAYASRLLAPTQALLNLQADIAASDAVFAKIFAYIDLLPETAEP